MESPSLHRRGESGAILRGRQRRGGRGEGVEREEGEGVEGRRGRMIEGYKNNNDNNEAFYPWSRLHEPKTNHTGSIL